MMRKGEKIWGRMSGRWEMFSRDDHPTDDDVRVWGKERWCILCMFCTPTKRKGERRRDEWDVEAEMSIFWSRQLPPSVPYYILIFFFLWWWCRWWWCWRQNLEMMQTSLISWWEEVISVHPDREWEVPFGWWWWSGKRRSKRGQERIVLLISCETRE